MFAHRNYTVEYKLCQQDLITLKLTELPKQIETIKLDNFFYLFWVCILRKWSITLFMSIFHILCSFRFKKSGFPGNIHCFASTGCFSLPSPWHLRHTVTRTAQPKLRSLVPLPTTAADLQLAVEPITKGPGLWSLTLAFLVEAQLIFTDLSHSFGLSNHTVPG